MYKALVPPVCLAVIHDTYKQPTPPSYTSTSPLDNPQAIDAQCFQDVSRTAWEATHSISNLSITPHVLINAILKRHATHVREGGAPTRASEGGACTQRGDAQEQGEGGVQVMDEHAWFTLADGV